MILKNKKTIERKLDEYKEAMNKASSLGSVEAVCPNCKRIMFVQDLNHCEGCEKVLCYECVRQDNEGTDLCDDCYASLKE